MLFLMFALAVGANALGTILIKIGTGKIGDISFSLSSIAEILKNVYILGGFFFIPPLSLLIIIFSKNLM